MIPASQALISIHERGFLFGDGIFESCKIFNGIIYDFRSHQRRIIKGLEALKFSAKIDDLEKKSYQLIKKNQIKNGILRISISRGIGSIGYLPSYESESLIIIEILPERKISPKGLPISLGVSEIKKPPRNCLPVHCKTMQSLPYVLTKIYAQKQNFFDSVMLSQKNFISETSSANIFWVKNSKIFTPSKACDILLGTIRQRILKISPIKIFEVRASLESLKNADEIFLTNSSLLLLSVDQFVWLSRKKHMTKKLSKNLGVELLKLLQEDVQKSCLRWKR